MALKFKTNVTHEGILFKAGQVVEDLQGVSEDLVKRGLVEQTSEAPTHSSALGNSVNEALPLAQANTSETESADPAAEAAAAEEAARVAAEQAAAIQKAEDEAALKAKKQTESADPAASIADDMQNIK